MENVCAVQIPHKPVVENIEIGSKLLGNTVHE